MLEIKLSKYDINCNKLPDNEYVKEYTITQGDTFTLKIKDTNKVMSSAKFKLALQNYTEFYSHDFEPTDVENEYACIVPSTDTNEFKVTTGSDPYIYEIEVTLTDGNKISLTKYYFNVENQVGDV